MRPSLDEIMVGYGSDKSSAPSEPWMWGQDYCRRIYEPLFAPIRDEPLTLLELGWGEYDPRTKDHSSPDVGGRSARAWSDYFEKAEIHVVEITPKVFADAASYPRVHLWQGSQADEDFLEHLHRHTGDFDVIVDDASHVSSLTIRSFEILWPFLKPGGVYVVEDLHSSYHDYYFGGDEACRDPARHWMWGSRADATHVPTAMAFFTRLAHEAFYTGVRPKGPAVDGDPCSWDCFPARYSLGYAIESITFAAPQAIVIRKRVG